MSRVKIKSFLTAGSLLVLLIMASTLAYFTSSDTVTNRFKVGKFDLEIIEPSYTDQQALSYAQMIAKDPCIENKGDSSAVVFMQVSFPKKAGLTTVETTGSTETLQNNADSISLFKEFYKSGDDTYIEGFDLTDWYQIGKPTSSADYDTYVFAYRYVLGTDTTDYKNRTQPLFDKVQLINIFEPDANTYNKLLNDSYQQIKIEAYGIQSKYLTEENGTSITLTDAQQKGTELIGEDILVKIHNIVKE